MNRHTAGLSAALVAALLAGCGSAPVKEPVQPDAQASTETLDTASLFDSLANPQPLPELPLTTRSFLLASEQPDTSASGYSFLLLPHIALDDAEREHQVMTCNALLTALQAAESRDEGEDSSDLLMPTYWPLFRDTNLEDCSELVESHDHQRARALLGELATELQEGPLLAAWPADGKQMLVLDISTFSDADIAEVLDFWTGRLARAPQLWEKGLDVTQIRVELRTILQKYGEMNLRVIKDQAD